MRKWSRPERFPLFRFAHVLVRRTRLRQMYIGSMASAVTHIRLRFGFLAKSHHALLKSSLGHSIMKRQRYDVAAISEQIV